MATNTSSTPTNPGRWAITSFSVPSVLKWQPFTSTPPSTPLDRDRLTALPAHVEGNLVLIRILTAGIAGVDNIQRAGGYPNPRCAEPGFTPGYDFVGEVVALGPDAVSAYANEVSGADSLAVGDKVASMCVLGAYATHILVPATELLKLKPTDDPVKAVALPLNYMTAYGMLRQSGVDLGPGSSILIGSASGGIGTALAQLVHAFDMRINMIGTCSPGKMDYLKSLGVTPVSRFGDIPAEVKKLTGGKGVDVAYDAVGSLESLAASRAATKEGTGQVIMIGIMDEIKSDGSGMRNPGAPVEEILGPRLGERTSFFNVERNYSLKDRGLFRKDFEDILVKVREGKLEPGISKLYRLSKAVEVNEMLVHGGGVTGKMVFVVDGKLAEEKGI